MARRPRPTKLKILKGEPNKDRINLNEPEAPPGAPERPNWLTAAGFREWARITEELGALTILSLVDRAGLWEYMKIWERAESAQRKIDRDGYFLKDRSGKSYKNPAISVVEEASRQKRMYLESFGLTPSSRSKLVAKPTKESKAGIGKYLA
jgi:P27 family predicted phage terminase small subunit